MWLRQPRTGRKPQPPRSNGLPAPRPSSLRVHRKCAHCADRLSGADRSGSRASGTRRGFATAPYRSGEIGGRRRRGDPPSRAGPPTPQNSVGDVDITATLPQTFLQTLAPELVYAARREPGSRVSTCKRATLTFSGVDLRPTRKSPFLWRILHRRLV